MASLRKSIVIAKPAAHVWDAVSDAGHLHTRLAPTLVRDTVMDATGAVRTVTFANGMILVEQIISNDAAAMRLAWTAKSENWHHHNASLRVIALSDDRSEIVWTADVLPHLAGDMIAQIMDAGLAATKAHLEHD